jgi:hypothetical protein
VSATAHSGCLCMAGGDGLASALTLQSTHESGLAGGDGGAGSGASSECHGCWLTCCLRWFDNCMF